MKIFICLAFLALGCNARESIPPATPQILNSSQPQQGEKLCLISDYVSDPTNATAGIQAAVDSCSSTSDGGTVMFDVPKTNYSTGSIQISGSNIHIQLSDTVGLLAGINREDYPGPQPFWYLLNFNDCHNCSLSGAGTIDGQARRYITGYKFDRAVVTDFKDPSCFNPWECRPRMLGIVNCTEVVVSGGISILDPIYWTVHVIGSKKVSLRDLTILGDWQVFNNDGIDIDSSEDVDIVGCHIDTADDAVCIKTTLRDTPASRIRVQDCRLRSRACAIKIGSESVADMNDMVFENIEIYNTHRGLGIQLRDQGDVSNVLYKNISATLQHDDYSWWGVSEALYVTAEPRFKGREVGFVSNITFEDLRFKSENGIFIDGGNLPSPALSIFNMLEETRATAVELPVEPHVVGVQITNLDLILRNKTSFEGGYQDYRPSEARDVQRSGGTAALWIEGAQNIGLEDVVIKYAAPKREDWTEVVHIEDSVDDVEMKGCYFGGIPFDIEEEKKIEIEEEKSGGGVYEF